MDSVDQVNDITNFLGGGWMSIVIGLLAAVILGWLAMKEKKAKRDAAEKETDLQRQREQAQTADRNQDLQEKWDDAADEIEKIRRDARKPEGGNNDQH